MTSDYNIPNDFSAETRRALTPRLSQDILYQSTEFSFQPVVTQQRHLCRGPRLGATLLALTRGRPKGTLSQWCLKKMVFVSSFQYELLADNLAAGEAMFRRRLAEGD